MSVHRSKEKNENHRFLKYSLKMGTSPKSSIFHSIYTYIVFKVFNRFNIYRDKFSIFFSFSFFHFVSRFVSPFCFPVVSPWCLPRAVIPMQRVGVSVLRQRARALVENESEQFPVASAVPVAPQWGEQRGKTTGTTIGKHNGKKNRKQQRKVKKHVCFFIY